MKKLVTLLLIFIFATSSLFAQGGKGIIVGVVKDLKTGNPVKNVRVIISQLKQQTFTDDKGEFKFENLSPAPYTLRFIHKEYNVLKMPHQEVFANSSIFIPVSLVPSTGEGEGTDESFMIGGIEVTAKKNVLTNKLNHVTEISSSEIEHLQATSLGDVMQLIPGVGMKNQGLTSQNQINLRGTSNFGITDLTSKRSQFGTKIMIDGGTISNNSNMNAFTGSNGISEYAGSGVDLREIPADNIESVEVLQGVASAKYGDYTEGVVIVKTKSGQQPSRFKFKDNPDTKEYSLSGGLNLFSENMGMNYNFNYANADKDIRKDGDNYDRFSGQLKFTNIFFDDKSLVMMNDFSYTRARDDYKGIITGETNEIRVYSHNDIFRYNNDITYKISNLEKMSFHLMFSNTNQDKYRQNYHTGTSSNARYIVTYTTPGTRLIDITTGRFLYKLYEEGILWNGTAELDWTRRSIKTGSFIHNLSSGIHYQYDDNTGKGYYFEEQKPNNPKERPYSFENIPANSILSLYVEDEINGNFIKPFTLNLGFRYEMYGPEGIQWEGLLGKKDFVKSRSGSYLEPRISLRIFLSPDTRLRIGYGIAAKAPSMDDIFPRPQYADVIDYFGDSRDTSMGYKKLITTYVFDMQNEYLRAYQENKFEFSLDQKITDDIGLTLRGYYSKRDREIVDFDSYPFLPVYYRPNYPNAGGEIFKNYQISSTIDIKNPKNKGYSEFSGLDLVVNTKKIESLNSFFTLTASYGVSKNGIRGGEYSQLAPTLWTSLDSVQKLYHIGGTNSTIIPVYQLSDKLTSWKQKLVFTYKWDYSVRKLGLWVTLLAQHVVGIWEKDITDIDAKAVGYINEDNGGTYYAYKANTPDAAKFYMKYKEIFTRPKIDNWSFNVNISKSLYKGAEVSFFANNFTDTYNSIFYGLEFSMEIDRIFE